MSAVFLHRKKYPLSYLLAELSALFVIKFFYISRKIPDSFAYLALNLNYPNTEDAARGLESGIISSGTARSIADTVDKKGYTNGDTVLGGAIQIHGCRIFEGKDQSRGCVEMLSQDMEIVFNIMEKGDKVIILP